jgi:4-amino-4-deoxy-L-arabinose transferase-like glycosyltransferase
VANWGTPASGRHQGFTRCPQDGGTIEIVIAAVGAGGLHMLERVPAIGFPSWVGSIRLVVAVAFAYFLAAQFSLALLTPDGVAVFWPAAGIASGILVALGPGARWPVAFGVVAATFAANLLGDRNLASTSVFALCNAGTLCS